MSKYRKVAFLFPGQGAQYPGMGREFVQNFSAARYTFEEADELLRRNLSDIILNGPESKLTETKNSQTGIFVTSIAIFRVFKELFALDPFVCAGLSLGEYTALVASERLSFIHGLPLVQRRAELMSQACEATIGTMAAVIGLDADAAGRLVKEVNLPQDLWVANFNCPGQVILSGTLKGIEVGTVAAKAKGAKKVIPLQVQGAFHSGLMREAEDRLAESIHQVPLDKGSSELVMNVPGNFVSDSQQMRQNLIKQVTSSVKWEQGIRAIEQHQVDLYIEFGPGKVLAGLNKRIGVQAPTFNLETLEDLDLLHKELR